jgi:alkylated DNA repair protein alkB family protein 6
MTSLDFMAMLRAERTKTKKLKKKSIFEQRKTKIDLKKYHLSHPTVNNVYYIPDFITKEEEYKLLTEIYLPSDKREDQWTSLTKRRLKNLGGAPHPDGLIETQLPQYVLDLKQVLLSCGLELGDILNVEHPTGYNQVLLNEYSNGKGISFHKDGELYYPCALVLSLESPALIEFCKQKPERSVNVKSECSVLLESRSLLIFTDEAYTSYYHGIQDRDQDEITENCINCYTIGLKSGDIISRGDKRVSLTIRCCVKVTDTKYNDHEREEMKRRAAWWIQSINEKE